MRQGVPNELEASGEADASAIGSGVEPDLIAAVLACLEGDRQPAQCIAHLPEFDADPGRVAALLAHFERLSRPQAAQVAAAYLLACPAETAVEEYMELHRLGMAENPLVDDLILEQGFAIASRILGPTWREELARSISPNTIFGRQKTDMGVVVANALARLGHPEMIQVLRDGMHRTDATEYQETRAVGSLAAISDSAFSRFFELSHAIEQSPIDQPSAAAEMAGILLLRPQMWPDENPQPAIELVDRVLSNPHWGPSLADQIKADYPSGPPPGVSREQWKTIELGLQYWE